MPRRALAALLLVLAWAGTAAPADDPTRLPGQPNDAAAAAYEKGERLNAAGKFDEAAQAFDEAARRAPLFTAAHHAAGNALAQAGKAREAEKRYRAAVAVDPRFVPSWNALGVVLLTSGRNEDALEAFDEALRVDPSHVLARLHRAEARIALGRGADAEADARELLRRDAANADARVVLGSAVAAQGRNDEALGIVDALLAEQPRHGAALLLRASLLLVAGKLGDAAECAAAALERAGDQPGVRKQVATLTVRLADAARRARDSAAEQRALETLVVLIPKSAAAHARLGAVIYRRWVARKESEREAAELDRARTEVERAIELDPEVPGAKELLELIRSR